MQISKATKRILIILIVVLNIGCDQISKITVRKTVTPNDYIALISDNFIHGRCFGNRRYCINSVYFFSV